MLWYSFPFLFIVFSHWSSFTGGFFITLIRLSMNFIALQMPICRMFSVCMYFNLDKTLQMFSGFHFFSFALGTFSEFQWTWIHFGACNSDANYKSQAITFMLCRMAKLIHLLNAIKMKRYTHCLSPSRHYLALHFLYSILHIYLCSRFALLKFNIIESHANGMECIYYTCSYMHRSVA